MIISLPVQTAVCSSRAAGALVMLVAAQLSGTGIVSPAGVYVAAPDDHFKARPDCRVTSRATGRIGGAGGYPTVRTRIVSPAGVQRGVIGSSSAPDNHLGTSPDGSMRAPCGGAFVVLVAVQLSVLGLYLPPVFKR